MWGKSKAQENLDGRIIFCAVNRFAMMCVKVFNLEGSGILIDGEDGDHFANEPIYGAAPGKAAMNALVSDDKDHRTRSA